MKRLHFAVLWVLSGILAATAWSQPRPKIVVTGISPAEVAELSAGARADFVAVSDPGEALREIPDADALLGICSQELVQAGKKLRWIQVYSAGVERYRFPELLNSDITLTNLKILQGHEIADHAMALLLAMTRRLNDLIPRRTAQEWPIEEFRTTRRPIELNGKTAVVIGFGGIGTQIGQRAAAFGMKVIAVDPKDIPFLFFVERTVRPDQLDEVLPGADVVFMAVPHTPESERMMGPAQFEMMKKGSYFVAVSRGKTYDKAALVKALDEQRLAGAGLDVTDPEPLPKGDPLWEFENVVITPHIAGQSDRIGERRQALLKENTKRFVAGATLLNIVDKQKGY
jgi:phosphoglycerate dehydrogenase-like enzyme